MSAVTLLAFASQADAIPQTEAAPSFAKASTGSSTPVDVSAHSVLRLDVDVRANLGAAPSCVLSFESAPSSSGPWTVLLAKQFSGESWPSGGARVVLDGFDRFVRVSWTAKARAHAPLNFQIGVTGEGVPDAA